MRSEAGSEVGYEPYLVNRGLELSERFQASSA